MKAPAFIAIAALLAVGPVGASDVGGFHADHAGTGWEVVRFSSAVPFTMEITLTAESGAVLSAEFFDASGRWAGALVNVATSGGAFVRAEDTTGIDVSYEADGGGGNVHSQRSMSATESMIAVVYAAGGIATWQYGFSTGVTVETLSSGDRTFYSDGPEFEGDRSVEVSLGRQTRYAENSTLDFEIENFFVGEVGGLEPDRLALQETITLGGPAGVQGCPCRAHLLDEFPAGSYRARWDGISHDSSRYMVLSGADVDFG